MSVPLESVLRDLHTEPAPPRNYAELREDKQRRRAWALKDLQAEKAQAAPKAAAVSSSQHAPLQMPSGPRQARPARSNHAPPSAASSMQSAGFKANPQASPQAAHAKAGSAHKRRFQPSISSPSTFEFAFEFPSDAEIAMAAAAHAPIKLNRGSSTGDSMDDDPSIATAASSSSPLPQPAPRLHPWSPQLLPAVPLQFAPTAFLPAVASSSAMTTLPAPVEDGKRRKLDRSCLTRN